MLLASPGGVKLEDTLDVTHHSATGFEIIFS